MLRTVALLSVGLVILAGVTASSVNKRAYVAGKFLLDLDGVATSILGTEGGGAYADVVDEKVGPSGFVKKHIAGVKYEDITINCGAGMSKSFYEWVKSSIDQKPLRKNGAIIAADYDYKEHSRLEFTNGLITEIGFPACDAGSKDAAKMTVKIAPETTRHKAGSGQTIKVSGAVQKKWLPSNFRLEIPGLDCSKVNKIEAITIKQKVVEDPVGELRAAEVSSTVVTLPESFAKSFYDWHEDFVIKGNSTDASEKTGSLFYLASDLKSVLFQLDFKGVGIFKVSPEKVEAAGENLRRVKAEMYCEEIHFNYLTAAGGEASP
jgi:T4-like virus tail tube protein gp19